MSDSVKTVLTYLLALGLFGLSVSRFNATRDPTWIIGVVGSLLGPLLRLQLAVQPHLKNVEQTASSISNTVGVLNDELHRIIAKVRVTRIGPASTAAIIVSERFQAASKVYNTYIGPASQHAPSAKARMAECFEKFVEREDATFSEVCSVEGIERVESRLVVSKGRAGIYRPRILRGSVTFPACNFIVLEYAPPVPPPEVFFGWSEFKNPQDEQVFWSDDEHLVAFFLAYFRALQDIADRYPPAVDASNTPLDLSTAEFLAQRTRCVLPATEGNCVYRARLDSISRELKEIAYQDVELELDKLTELSGRRLEQVADSRHETVFQATHHVTGSVRADVWSPARTRSDWLAAYVAAQKRILNEMGSVQRLFIIERSWLQDNWDEAERMLDHHESLFAGTGNAIQTRIAVVSSQVADRDSDMTIINGTEMFLWHTQSVRDPIRGGRYVTRREHVERCAERFRSGFASAMSLQEFRKQRSSWPPDSALVAPGVPSA